MRLRQNVSGEQPPRRRSEALAGTAAARGRKKGGDTVGLRTAGVRVRVLGPNWSPWNNVMQERGQYTRGSLPQCERSVKESLSFLPGGYFFRSWIPLRQRDSLKRDFMAKDTVYPLFLRGLLSL